MNFTDFSLKLFACFEENNLSHLLSEEASSKLFRLAELLVETNKHTNLTAITDINGIIFKHFADCALLCDLIPEGASVIDVGCGAGFPSLPLAILRPDLRITALDSTAKKISFIKNAAKEINLCNITGISARAEEFVQSNREAFDIATSRAVARLNILCELCIPFVRVGGAFIPLKASKAQEELDEAISGIKMLGATVESIGSYELRHLGERLERHTICIRKSSQTNKHYPRKYAQMLKKPL